MQSHRRGAACIASEKELYGCALRQPRWQRDAEVGVFVLEGQRAIQRDAIEGAVRGVVGGCAGLCLHPVKQKEQGAVVEAIRVRCTAHLRTREDGS